jgi:hypothetical protein
LIDGETHELLRPRGSSRSHPGHHPATIQKPLGPEKRSK